MALEGLRRGIQGALSRLRGKRSIDEEELRGMVKDLRRALLAADFNVRQTKEITDRLELRMRDDEPRPGLTLQTHAMNIIYAELVRLLGAPREILPFNQRILMVGLYGQGKTTTTAKIAAWWKRKHKLEIGVNSSTSFISSSKNEDSVKEFLFKYLDLILDNNSIGKSIELKS